MGPSWHGGYQEGFNALNSGEYRRAVELLERAAAEAGLTSDIVNHAFTLALFRAGEKARLADVAFGIALNQVDDDPASAMDYFQRAVQAGLDTERLRRIGEVFEKWAGERTVAKLQGRIDQVAHVVTSLHAGLDLSSYMRMLAESLKLQGVRSTIFTTESTAGWFSNPSVSAITNPSESGVIVAATEGDFVQRSDRIADAVRQSGIPLVFFHSDLSDQISCRVAALRPASVQVNVAHNVPADADLFDGFVYLSQNGLARSRFQSRPSEWIPPSSDVETRMQSSAFESRESLAIDPMSTVSASFSGPTRGQNGFVNIIVEILKRFPRHFHFFAGPSDVRAFRGVFHSEGVLSRVRFLGPTGNTTPMLRAVDVYLAAFPDMGRTSILDMMGAAKPVVAMRFAADSEFNTAAELVGELELTPRTQAEYVQIADRLIRNSEVRARLGERLQERFRQEFSPELMGARYVEFFEKLR